MISDKALRLIETSSGRSKCQAGNLPLPRADHPGRPGAQHRGKHRPDRPCRLPTNLAARAGAPARSTILPARCSTGFGYAGWVGCEHKPPTTTEAGPAGCRAECAGILRQLFDAAIVAADLESCVPAPYAAGRWRRLIVIGAGKASAAMARAVEQHWSGPLTVWSSRAHGVPCERIEIVEAAHLVPDVSRRGGSGGHSKLADREFVKISPENGCPDHDGHDCLRPWFCPTHPDGVSRQRLSRCAGRSSGALVVVCGRQDLGRSMTDQGA